MKLTIFVSHNNYAHKKQKIVNDTKKADTSKKKTYICDIKTNNYGKV